MNNDLEKLLELIDRFVNEERPWKEKRDYILSNTSESDKLNLLEFARWFE